MFFNHERNLWLILLELCKSCSSGQICDHINVYSMLQQSSLDKQQCARQRWVGNLFHSAFPAISAYETADSGSAGRTLVARCIWRVFRVWRGERGSRLIARKEVLGCISIFLPNPKSLMNEIHKLKILASQRHTLIWLHFLLYLFQCRFVRSRIHSWRYNFHIFHSPTAPSCLAIPLIFWERYIHLDRWIPNTLPSTYSDKHIRWYSTFDQREVQNCKANLLPNSRLLPQFLHWHIREVPMQEV